jgi:hypothetical protein
MNVIIAARICACSIILLAAGNASAPQVGKWAKSGAPAQINTFCVQVWSCGPSHDVVYDASKTLVSTPNDSTRGVCSAGGGAIDSCNVCLSSPPTRSCLWHLEDDD